MSKLIPLKDIPYSARSKERQARAKYPSRSHALMHAEYRMVSAPGCHSEAYFDPPCIGWVVTRDAAEAIAARMTRMPGGSVHRRLTIEHCVD